VTAGGRPGRRRWRRLWVGIPAALLAVLPAGCNRGPAPAQGPKAVEVVVTTPITGQVTDYQDFTGRLDAVKTVEVRARVSGYLNTVPFKEGDEVHEGDLLFQIDPRPYKAQLDAAQAQLKAAEAQIAVGESNLKLAQITYARARASGAGATALEIDQDLAQQQTSEAQLRLARANLGTARANLDTARLNYEWTRVTAPVSGRISRRFVDPGNLVTTDTTLLTTIVTENPLYAYFDVDERTYLDLAEKAGGEQSSWLAGLQLPVLIRLANEDQFGHAGTIDFIDNRVNAGTGTIRMRGVFQNPTKVLKSGLFVRIRLPLGAPYQALLIPDEALQSDQGRKYVYVVNGKNEAEYRSVKLGQALHGLRVIKEGLAGGERVIIGGMQRVRPKAQVQPTVQAPPKAPESPLSKLLTLDPAGAGPRKPAGGR
jgi:multidrug efflux system membrane fusion protein